MKIINANGLLLGRLASEAAKASLLGEDVIITNCEKAVLSGTKKNIIAKQKLRYERGTHVKGPFYERTPHLFVKRAIRGMLPWRQTRGREAYKRIRCYAGEPVEYQGKGETLAHADHGKLPKYTYLTVGQLIKEMGGK